MDKVGIVLGLVALVCVLLPCKWDPAIRLKASLDGMQEWFEGWDDHEVDDHEEEREVDDH
jgi:hypothetical protein